MSSLEEKEEPGRPAKRIRGDELRRVKINVGGTVYEVAASTIMKYPQTMLGSMLSSRWEVSSDEELFIDRDPTRFRYILDFYRDGKISLPITMSKTEMLREAEFFALPTPEDIIKIDATEMSSLREAVSTFENSLIESYVEEARTRYLTARAYELAAVIIKKMKCFPFNETVELTGEEIYNDMGIPDDPLFKETITGLVEEAGYHFAEDISSFSPLSISRGRR